MNGSFSAQAVRIGDLLSGTAIYAMPGFQRPYAWTREEVARLLDDLLYGVNDADLQPGSRSVLFLGTIVLIETAQSTATPGGAARNQRFDVVDGQQRLITLALIFAAVRDLGNRLGSTELAERMDRLIAIHGQPDSSGRTYRIGVRAKDTRVLVDFVQQMDGCLAEADPDEFEGAQRELIRNRNHIYEELKALDMTQLTRLADFLETRCQVVAIITDDTDNAFRIFTVVNQQGKPLARNDLLKAELIGELPADEHADYVARWEQVEGLCGADFEQVFAHIRTAFGNGRNPIINEIRRLSLAAGGAKAFLDQRLLPMATLYGGMRGHGGAPAVLNAPALRHVRYLERLSHSDWLPSALLWAYQRPGDATAIADFVANLDRFAHGQMLLGIGRDKRATRYGAILEAIRSGRAPHTERGLMTFAAEEQRNILFNATHSMYGRSSIGAKLLLLRLNDALQSGQTLVEPDTVSVEHVLPQKIGRASPWRHWFTDGQHADYVGSLGNMILVLPKTNKAVRNDGFALKLEGYGRDPMMARLPLNQGILGSAQFGPAQIEAREQRLITVMRGLWGLDAAFDRRPPA